MTNAPHHRCCQCRMCSRTAMRPRPRTHATPLLRRGRTVVPLPSPEPSRSEQFA